MDRVDENKPPQNAFKLHLLIQILYYIDYPISGK